MGRSIVEIILKGVDNTGDATKGASDNLADVEESLNKVAKVAIAVGTAIVASMTVATQSTASYLDEARKFERATGIQVETLQALRFAVQRWGGAQKDADVALKRFSKNVFDATQGLSTAVRAFEQVGIAIEDLTNDDGSLRTLDDLLPVIADKYSVMTDSTLKAAIAQDLFGRGGLKMVPFLNQGAAGFEELKKRAEELGIVLDENVDEAEEHQDAMLDMKEGVRGVAIAIGSELMPVFTRLFNHTTDYIIRVRKWITAHKDLIPFVLALGVALIGSGGLVMAITTTMAAIKAMTFLLGATAGPIGIAVAVVGALTAGLTLLALKKIQAADAVEAFEDRLTIATRSLESSEEKAGTLKKEIERLTGKIEDGGVAAQFYREELERVQKEYEDTENAANGYRGEIEKITQHTGIFLRFSELSRELGKNEDRFKAIGLEIQRVTDDMSNLWSEGAKKNYIERLTREADALRVQHTELLRQIAEITPRTDAATDATDEFTEALRRQTEAYQKQSHAIRERDEKLFDPNEGVDIEREPITIPVMIVGESKARENINQLTGALETGIGRSLSLIGQKTTKLKDLWNTFWRSMADHAISEIARVAAAKIAGGIGRALLGAVVGGVGGGPAGAVVGFTSGLGVAHSGGEVIAGTRAFDSAPVMTRRGERIVDPDANDDLKEFLSENADGGAGSIQVVQNIGISTASSYERSRSGRSLKGALNQYDTVVAKGAL